MKYVPRIITNRRIQKYFHAFCPDSFFIKQTLTAEHASLFEFIELTLPDRYVPEMSYLCRRYGKNGITLLSSMASDRLRPKKALMFMSITGRG